MGDVTVDSSICLQSGIVQNKLMWKWLKLSNIQQCWDNEVMLHKTWHPCQVFLWSFYGLWPWCLKSSSVLHDHDLNGQILCGQCPQVLTFIPHSSAAHHCVHIQPSKCLRLRLSNLQTRGKSTSFMLLVHPKTDLNDNNGWSFHLYCHVYIPFIFLYSQPLKKNC